MANTFTISSLTETLFQARDIVAAEPTGFIQSVLINAGSEGVSLGGTVTSHVTAASTLNTSYTPAMTIPAGDDETLAVETMTIGQVANVKVSLRGEERRQLDNTTGIEVVMKQRFTQAFRSIRNAIETHCGTTIKNGSSRATGTAGTTPFASTLADASELYKILKDNGTPIEDGQCSLIINTTAGVKLRNLTQFQKVNEAGDSNLLRRGELGNIMNFSVKESAGVATHTKGTLAGSPTTNNAGYAIGATTLTLASAGTGTIVAGDAINLASENNGIWYIVKTGDTDVSDGGTVVLNKPGLRLAASAATKALTLAANYTANLAFHRNAVELVMRPPAQPFGGDAAVDRMTMVDDKTGLVFEVAHYKGYGMEMFDITCFYQCKVWKPEFVATLLG